MIAPELMRQLVVGRLLVLQSKRLLLHSSERRLNDSGADFLRERVDRLRVETTTAQYHYRESMLRWGSPKMQDYWPTAYGRLIEMGTSLSSKLRTAADDVPPAERYDIATDVEMLESMMKGWSRSMRAAMAASVT